MKLLRKTADVINLRIQRALSSIYCQQAKYRWKSVPIKLELYLNSVHEITAGHRSLSGTISCVTDRIRFLPVTMTGRFSNFNSTSYTEDWHELRVTGKKCRLPNTMSDTGEMFISDADSSSQTPKSWPQLSQIKKY